MSSKVDFLTPIPKTVIQVSLPSRGIPYKTSPLNSGKISLSPMSIIQENMLISPNVESDIDYISLIDKVLKQCIKEKEPVDVNSMLSADKMFLFMMLRAVTYGPEYSVSWKCTQTNRNEVCETNNRAIIRIPDDFKIKKLGDDDIEPYKVELPDSHKVISFRLSRGSDEYLVEKRKMDIRRKNKTGSMTVPDDTSVYRLALLITHVDGNEVTVEMIEPLMEFIASLSMRDIRKIRESIDFYTPGLDTVVKVECSKCHKVTEMDVPITVDFFRPVTDDDRGSATDEVRADVLPGYVPDRDTPVGLSRTDMVLDKDAGDKSTGIRVREIEDGYDGRGTSR